MKKRSATESQFRSTYYQPNTNNNVDYLQRVVDLQSRQLQHFLFNQIKQDDHISHCSRRHCREESSINKSMFSTQSRSKRYESQPSISLYAKVSQARDRIIQARRKLIEDKEQAKQTHLLLLKHQKQAQLREKCINQRSKRKQNLRLREEHSYIERIKTQSIREKIEQRDRKLRQFLYHKRNQINQADGIRREISRKKQLIIKRIAQLKQQGLENNEIVSIISTESQQSIQRLTRLSEKARSLRNGKNHMRPTNASDSQYFTALTKTSSPKKPSIKQGKLYDINDNSSNNKISSQNKNLKVSQKKFEYF